MINIKCGHLVCVKGDDGNFRNIMFKPTEASRRAVYAARDDGKRHGIKVDDISGLHESVVDRRVTHVQESYGTVIFTTE